MPPMPPHCGVLSRLGRLIGAADFENLLSDFLSRVFHVLHRFSDARPGGLVAADGFQNVVRDFIHHLF